ncbi:hypothetical protein ACTOB_001248 [Actinoplanes oblitus]|uniref:NlpC/P60 domain-containing protein n=1 Tax=Actinoplanes oblitus TaxID=3040509 RepID=A0ABY8WLI0_9ACTN|nr:hypothetical protein [Actinoplanes oblitus]WIM97700.1 hypothetical protein ACTOB_001248 [Actinoplanes oblitus]
MPLHTMTQARPVWRPPATSDWTVERLTGPNRLIVRDRRGVLATLTENARTVTYRNRTRTFLEQKEAFTDEFRRTWNNGFGSSPGGGNWTTANGADSDYSVALVSDEGRARIRLSSIDSSRYATILDTLKTVDARAQVTTSATPVGDFSSIALLFAYEHTGEGVQNHNRAKLTFNTDGTVFAQLTRRTNGVEYPLTSAVQIATGYTAGQRFWIRATTDGAGHHAMYAWRSGTTEPASPTCSATDTFNTIGRVGFRAIVGDTWTGGTSTFADIYSLSVVATWPAPPVVTHDTWGRLLPAPFDGTWSRRTRNLLRRWTVDTSPDILSYAMAYVSGALVVLNAAGTKWYTGAAGYGPLDEFGKRIEGADAFDYDGTDVTWPGDDPDDPAEPAELHCLDCSGLVRRVFGFHLGMPLVRNDPTTFDGLSIPRRTADIGPRGPGQIITQAVGTKPTLGLELPCDVIFHDADQSDPEEGTIDHDGIIIGTDATGVIRFISSRKTINGPTFSDLGGRSAVNGTGTYPNRLRIIRRF